MSTPALLSFKRVASRNTLQPTVAVKPAHVDAVAVIIIIIIIPVAIVTTAAANAHVVPANTWTVGCGDNRCSALHFRGVTERNRLAPARLRSTECLHPARCDVVGVALASLHHSTTVAAATGAVGHKRSAHRRARRFACRHMRLQR